MPAFIVIAILRRIVNSDRFQSTVRARLGRGQDLPEGDVAIDGAGNGTSIVGRAARALVVLVVVSMVTWVIGQLVARRLSYGDESSDDFQLAVIMGGAEFRSFAAQLRSATVITFWSGLRLDLREATLSPGGADLELRNVLAGVEVRIPPTWRVELDSTVAGGEFTVDLPGADELPDDAPTLRIHAATTMAGGLVTSTRD